MTAPAWGASFPRALPWVVVGAVLLGAYLRLDQFGAQVLIDDEWHAVHQLLRSAPAQMVRDFGYSDYSIPLGLLYWVEARFFGLSEELMRWPMMLCGLATLVLLPWYVGVRLGWATAAVFAVLIAISPLLYLYSRMARPYAVTLLLVWCALAAFQRFHSSPQGGAWAGAAFAITAVMAIWLHPIVAPFAVAPFLQAVADLRLVARSERWARVRRLAGLGLAAGALLAVVILPPFLTHPESLAGKSGVDHPRLDTLAGVWHVWLGTPSTTAVLFCVVLAAYGAKDAWRGLPVARSGAIGALLTVVAVFATRPASTSLPITFGRYLLPFLPLLLLATAAGSVKLASRLAAGRRAGWQVAALIVALSPALALAARSPLATFLRFPNGQTQHLYFYLEFRPGRNLYDPYIAAIPLSPFWKTLAAVQPGSLRIAAAPFSFESYNWDAPRWEEASRQYVIPAYLTGFCVDRRYGELPRTPAFRFRNAVHLADAAGLATLNVRYIVWQKPYERTVEGRPIRIGAETAHCEDLLRARFGQPAYEDGSLVAFRVPEPGHAER